MLALLLGLLALSQTNSVVGQFRTSRNERDLALARQAAEAALRDAEADITCQVWDKGQLVQTTNAANTAVNTYCLSLAPTCSAMMPTQDEPGMRLLGRTPTEKPAAIDWNAEACTGGSCAVQLGTKTKATAVAGVAALPRYHIDVLDAQLAATYEPSPLFRITARGYGATQATVVDLQEVYRPCK
ncbi:MAG: pilus assembly protein [Ideonella sp.]|nr:pilus assembly protein [Ideonella sp.]